MTKQDKVEKVMHEWKAGTLTSNGKQVTDYDQAVAIALSEAGLSKYDEGGSVGNDNFYVKSNFGNFSVTDRRSNKMVVGYSKKEDAIITAKGLNDIDNSEELNETIIKLKTMKGYGHFLNQYAEGGVIDADGEIIKKGYKVTNGRGLTGIVKEIQSNGLLYIQWTSDNGEETTDLTSDNEPEELYVLSEYEKGGNMNKYAKGGAVDAPKIYVADLEAYNNGKLVGEWLDLSDFKDGKDVSREISKLLKKWGAEEYAIHDVENVPSSIYSEYMGEEDFDKIIKIYKASEENDLPYEVISEIILQYEPKDLEEWISDHYEGHFDNDTDLAYSVVENMGGVSDLGKKTTEMYFDYEGFGRDLEINDEWEGDFDSDEDRAYDYVENMGGVSELGDKTIDMYFDYEKFGRDLAINDYTEIEDGYYFRTPRYAKGGTTNKRKFAVGGEIGNTVSFKGDYGTPRSGVIKEKRGGSYIVGTDDGDRLVDSYEVIGFSETPIAKKKRFGFFEGGGEILATSPSKDGIKKIIEQYLYGSTITLVETDNDKIYEVHNKKGKTPFHVEVIRGRYKFIQTDKPKFAGGGEIENKIEKLKKVVSSKMLPESVKAKAQAEIDKLEKELHESKETKAEEKEEHEAGDLTQKEEKRLNELQAKEDNDNLNKTENSEYEKLVVKYRKAKENKMTGESEGERKAGMDEEKDYVEAKTKALEKSLKDKTISETQRKRDEKELALFKGAGKAETKERDETEFNKLKEKISDICHDKLGIGITSSNLSTATNTEYTFEPKTKDSKYDGMMLSYDGNEFEVFEFGMATNTNKDTFKVFGRYKNLQAAITSLSKGNTENRNKTTRKAPVRKAVVKKAVAKKTEVKKEPKFKVGEFVLASIFSSGNKGLKFKVLESKFEKDQYIYKIYLEGEGTHFVSEHKLEIYKKPKADHKKLVAKLKAKKGGKEYDNRASLVPFTETRRNRSESSDKKRSALPPGKRVSENGVTYYESRLNRTDLSKEDKFKTGGEIKKADRIEKMVENWKKYGFAISSVSKTNDDADFFKALKIDQDEVGITSQTGNDVVYYNTKVKNKFNRDDFEKGGELKSSDWGLNLNW